jgi:hypothetical protein
MELYRVRLRYRKRQIHLFNSGGAIVQLVTWAGTPWRFAVHRFTEVWRERVQTVGEPF